MRDTIIGILVVGGLGIGWVQFKKLGLALIPTPQGSLASQHNPVSTTVKPHNNTLGGNNNAQKPNIRHYFKNRRYRKNKGTSGTHSQNKTVPSIYHNDKTIRSVDKELNPRGLVPASAYLASQRNQLAPSPTPEEAGMRVFIQCMELDSGRIKQTSRAQCTELARKSTLTQGQRQF